MPEYVLNRDYTLRTTLGVVSFKKGEPTWVVPAMEREAAGIGAERVDGKSVDLLDAEKPKVQQLDMSEREAQIKLAFDLIIEKNDAKEFTAQGVPTSKAVERIVGFDVERGEITELWAAVKAEKAEQQ